MVRLLRLQSFILATFLIALLAVTPAAEACTGLRLIAQDNNVLVGRTMEFGFDVASNAMVIPKGTELTTTINDKGTIGFKYSTKHAIVGANALGYDIIVDGINDAGLYVAIHYFPGYASYPDLGSVIKDTAMAPHEYATWLLARFADVEEVKANFNNVSLVPVVIEEIDSAAPVHVVVHDSKGKSVVIEPIDKSLKLFDNPLGVFTNSPSFDWHMTNLNNYLNLTLNNVPPVVLNDKPTPRIMGGDDDLFTLQAFGQGSGLHGLPGDITPPSRFVRAVAYSQGAIPPNGAKDGVPQVFHIMNAFDIPVGSAREMSDEGELHTDYTVWTTVSDLKNQDWYFRTYKDQTIRRINLKEAVAKAKGKIQYINMDYALDYPQPFTDVSNEFFNPNETKS